MVWMIRVTLALAVASSVASATRRDNNVGISILDRIVFPDESAVLSPFLPKPAGAARNIRTQFIRAAEAVYGVAVRLKVFLHVNNNTNFLVSPVSVAAAIGELLLGANGRSREQLQWLLSTENNTAALDKDDMLTLHRQLGGLMKMLVTTEDSQNDGYVMNMASAFFVQPDLKMKQSYVDAVTQLYGLQFYPLDFSSNPAEAQKVVNQWTWNHTHGKISEAVPEGLPPTTSTLLLNAVYFKGNWETPFDPELTIPGVFHISEDKRVRVDFMRGQFETLYVESEQFGCRIVALPYNTSQAAMYIVMPLKGQDKYDLQKYLATLTFYNVRDILASAEKRSVTIVMPKMVLKDTLSIRQAVTKIQEKLKEKNNVGPGPPPSRSRRYVSDVKYYWRYNFKHQYYFTIPTRLDNGRAGNDTSPTDEKLDLDMSGASADLRFRVDDVLHQIVVEISEKGTEAAAVSSSTVDYIGDVKVFKVDSPFMFFVRHEATLASLFWGVIVDPKDGRGEYL